MINIQNILNNAVNIVANNPEILTITSKVLFASKRQENYDYIDKIVSEEGLTKEEKDKIINEVIKRQEQSDKKENILDSIEQALKSIAKKNNINDVTSC